MAAVYLGFKSLQYQLVNIRDGRGPEVMASVILALP